VGLRRATRGRAIVTERAGREKCWRNADKLVDEHKRAKPLRGLGCVASLPVGLFLTDIYRPRAGSVSPFQEVSRRARFQVQGLAVHVEETD